MDIERLSALVQSWREIAEKHDARAERLNESGDASDAAWCEAAAEHRSYCADELATLIAELGQEVGAVALIEAARDWIAKAPHGDNCYLDPDHAYGNSCYCGKESILSVLESPAHTSEARDAEIARLCAQLADMEHGFRDMASKWSHDAAEMTHGIAATAVRSCVDEVFEFLGPDYDAAMRQEAE